MAVIVLAALFALDASAAIYKWTDSSGRVHFSDHKPQSGPVQSVHLHDINSYKNVTYQLAPDDTAAAAGNARKKVVMYSTSWCTYCKKARAFFAANDIPYTDYDIEKSRQARARYDAFGGNGVPVIFVGRSRMNGFSARTFEYLYRR